MDRQEILKLEYGDTIQVAMPFPQYPVGKDFVGTFLGTRGVNQLRVTCEEHPNKEIWVSGFYCIKL